MRIKERKVLKEMDEHLTLYRPETTQRKEEPVKKRGIQIDKFFYQNPEMVIRLMLVAFVIILAACCLSVRHSTVVKLTEQYREEIAAVRFQTEQEVMARMKEQYGINAQNMEKATMEEEAKTVAKVLYAMRNNRELGLQLACWCVFDRKDNVIYPDDVLAVCSADQAFMGWSENNPVLDELYNIALKEVQRWHTGVRPMDTSFVYLYWTPNEIYLFDDYGHRYYESDFAKYLDTHE